LKNIEQPKFLIYTDISTATISLPLGAAGWIDTDVSAVTGTLTDRIWIILVASAGGDVLSGVRTHGSAEAPLLPNGTRFTVLAKVSSTGHLDFYRDAGTNINFLFLGYIS